MYLILQIQELGDLQLALNMKQEYRKMQRSLQQKNRQYQDVMCEKLELQKQVGSGGKVTSLHALDSSWGEVDLALVV